MLRRCGQTSRELSVLHSRSHLQSDSLSHVRSHLQSDSLSHVLAHDDSLSHLQSDTRSHQQSDTLSHALAHAEAHCCTDTMAIDGAYDGAFGEPDSVA